MGSIRVLNGQNASILVVMMMRVVWRRVGDEKEKKVADEGG